ncbi:hypothetical protein BWD41_15260 [Citrobacter braakii]|uniref:Uncharacterized protein n=1 Tax=Citrobacter braakii TaxID=57706 RepID=A0AA44LDQ6_CITBR|nr:hypothetical protein BWD41_15260 [Citrobacter braakii]
MFYVDLHVILQVACALATCVHPSHIVIYAPGDSLSCRLPATRIILCKEYILSMIVDRFDNAFEIVLLAQKGDLSCSFRLPLRWKGKASWNTAVL